MSLAWIKSIAGKFSIVALLREQLALAQVKIVNLEAENADLRAKVASLTLELKQAQMNLSQEKQQHEALKEEHIEEVRIWRTLEFRRGKRTFWNWAAFCPKCKMPVHSENEFLVVCSSNCGWKCGMNADEAVEILELLQGGEWK